MPRIPIAPIARAAFALVACTLLLATACSDDGASPAATATTPPTATSSASTPTATVTPADTATPVPTSASSGDDEPGGAVDGAVPVYPTDIRSGIPIVDAALDAALDGDAAALAALADFMARPCTEHVQGIGALPCPDGVADGTLIDVIQAAYCEGTWVMPDDIEETAERLFQRSAQSGGVEPLRLYAIARLGDDPTLAGSRYRLLLAFPDGTGRQVWLSDEGVTMLWWGCGDPPVTEMIAISSAQLEPEWVLPPLDQ